MLTVHDSSDGYVHDCVGNIQRINTDTIKQLLQNGSIETCRETLKDYFEKIEFNKLESLLFRLYIVMDIYIVARSFSKSIGISSEDFVKRFGSVDDIEGFSSNEATIEYFTDMILQCMKWRTELARKNGSNAIKQAKQYINEKYTMDDISLKSVAAAMNFSPTYFSSLFKKETGMNFVSYLTQVRIEEAKTLLCCTSKMVYEVAYEVGFRDYRYFGQIFKKYTGKTPHEFQSCINKKASFDNEPKS